jgi:hypothetical protein
MKNMMTQRPVGRTPPHTDPKTQGARHSELLDPCGEVFFPQAVVSSCFSFFVGVNVYEENSFT